MDTKDSNSMTLKHDGNRSVQMSIRLIQSRKTRLIQLNGLMVLLSICISACQSSGPKNTYRDSSQERPLVDEKYSIRQDRQALDEIRKDIEPEKKQANDELAFFLNLTDVVKRKPEDIRSKFDQIVRKKREVFSKDITKEREQFTKQERKSREEFLNQQKRSRDEFMKSKNTKQEKDDFFKAQDAKRTEYFAAERERRNDFESDVTERRKNFEDYIREKNSMFQQELNSYRKRYEDAQKQEEKQRLEQQKLEQQNQQGQ